MALGCATARASTIEGFNNPAGNASGYAVLDCGGSSNSFNLSGGSTTFSGANFTIGIANGSSVGAVATSANESGAVVQCYTTITCNSSNIPSPLTVEQGASYNTALNSAVAAVTSVYNAATSLPATQTSGTSTGNMTFTSTAGNNQLNVVDLTNGINQTSGTITISGNATDFFVFVVANGQLASSNGGTSLSGGITASNILWVVEGASGQDVTLQNGPEWDGSILAPTATITVHGAGNEVYNGSLISGAGVTITSNPTLNDADAFVGMTATPEPGTMALLGLGIGALAVYQRRRREFETQPRLN